MEYTIPIRLIRPGNNGPITTDAGLLARVGNADGNLYQLLWQDGDHFRQPLAIKCPKCEGFYLYKECNLGCPSCNQEAYSPKQFNQRNA